MRSIPLVLALLIVVAAPATAVPGDLDPSFSDDGIAFAYPNGALATSGGIDGHDRLVVAGYTLGDDPDVAVARFRPDGTLDPAFGQNGRVKFDLGGDDYGLDVAVVEPAGIVVVGRTITPGADVGFVLRLDAAGARASSFGGGDGLVRIDFGRRSQSANAVAVTPRGRFVVGGFASNNTTTVTALARLLSDGRFDHSFADTGRRTVDLSDGDEQINDLLVLAGGAVLTAGEAEGGAAPRFALARFAAGGSLDPTFGSHGVTRTDVSAGPDIATAMALRADGTIVLVGRAGNGGAYDWGLARYTAEGLPDAGFGGDGSVVLHFTSAVEEATGVVREGARIVVVGRVRGSTSDDLAVARVRKTGALDSTFGGGDGLVLVDVDGGADTAVDVSRQSDGKIVAAGTATLSDAYRFLATRMLPA